MFLRVIRLFLNNETFRFEDTFKSLFKSGIPISLLFTNIRFLLKPRVQFLPGARTLFIFQKQMKKIAFSIFKKIPQNVSIVGHPKVGHLGFRKFGHE